MPSPSSPSRSAWLSRTLNVAWREFTSTVFTRGFLIGLLLTPSVLVLMLLGTSLVRHLGGPHVSGVVTVVDRSGSGVGAHVERAFSPQGLADERRAQVRRLVEQGKELARDFAPDASKHLESADEDSLISAVDAGQSPATLGDIHVELLPDVSDAQVAEMRDKLADVDVYATASDDKLPQPRLMLVVIPPEAVHGASSDDAGEGDGEGGAFQVFVPPGLDFQVRERLVGRIARSIVEARLATDPRIESAGLSVDLVRRLTKEPPDDTKVVTHEGARASSDMLQMLIPAAFMALLLVAVMTGGQYLLTTTIEEKSSRVMEVLLSAVSPMQLMTGKILGQMAASLVVLVVYSGLGLTGLVALSMMGQLALADLLLLGVFFFLAFLTVASFLAAVGSAVTELREAQTLQAPLMAVVLLPWLLWLPISRAPNSTLATVLSMVPGINPFVMVIRLGSSEPVPAVQIVAAVLVAALTACVSLWMAAKIFRVGVLMYGKPPNFRTLIKWVRMA